MSRLMPSLEDDISRVIKKDEEQKLKNDVYYLKRENEELKKRVTKLEKKMKKILKRKD